MNTDIKVGYRIIGSAYVPVVIDLFKNGHWLIVGDSGSGKSVLTTYLLNSLLNIENLILYVADFKASGDYDCISEHYATFTDCIKLVDDFYEHFQRIKKHKTGEHILLIFDEYASCCLSIQDKKVLTKLQNQISEILMQGRCLPGGGSAFTWQILQRPDAEYFSHGSRQNYFVTIVMKEIGKSTRLMLDIDEDDIPAEHIAETGHGIIVQTGKPIYAFIVPFVNLDALRMHLQYKAEQLSAKRQRSKELLC